MLDSGTIYTIVETAIVTVILALSTFWAFRIRRALAPSSRFYRNQALGLGLVAASLATLNFVANTVGKQYSDLIDIPFLYITFLTIFYWLDTSGLAAKKSDLLSRDTLKWSTIRLFLWPFNLISLAYFVLLVAASGGFNTATLVNSYGPLNLTDAVFLMTMSILVVILTAGILLPICAMRATDSTLRRHLTWFGLGILFLTLPLIFSGVVGDLGVVGLSYCLYRSAKHLIPLNRLPLP